MISLARLKPAAIWLGYHGAMSPVEAMARSHHDRLQVGRKRVAWEQTPPHYRDEMMREAASDMLALAEVLRLLLW